MKGPNEGPFSWKNLISLYGMSRLAFVSLDNLMKIGLITIRIGLTW